jgi:hypothetical protein
MSLGSAPTTRKLSRTPYLDNDAIGAFWQAVNSIATAQDLSLGRLALDQVRRDSQMRKIVLDLVGEGRFSSYMATI